MHSGGPQLRHAAGPCFFRERTADMSNTPTVSTESKPGVLFRVSVSLADVLVAQANGPDMYQRAVDKVNARIEAEQRRREHEFWFGRRR